MFFNCFIFAQVGALMPVSGANYVLCSGAVNGTWGFMYVWGFLMANSFLFPIMSRTASNYLAVFFPAIADHVPLVSVIIIVVTVGINLLGTSVSTKVQNAAVVILIAVVLIFSAGGIIHADWSHFDPMMPKGFMPVVMGAISTYYAFAGVNNIVELSGEIKNPGKNIPRTIFISFGIVVVMYIGMCVGLVALVPADELNVALPAVTAAERAFPAFFRYFVSLAAIAASWTTLNAVIAGMARNLYMLGRVQLLPKSFAKTNKNGAPSIVLIVLMIAGCLMVVFSATVMQYVNISSFYLLWIAFLVAFASLRIKDAFPERYEKSPYKLQGIWYYVWPVLALVSGVVFMILQFRDDPGMTGVSVILVPLGVLFYYLRKRNLAAKGINVDEELSKNM